MTDNRDDPTMGTCQYHDDEFNCGDAAVIEIRFAEEDKYREYCVEHADVELALFAHPEATHDP